ncbi:hypothetical protein J4430_03715 [Candidatus Woesearchaeota archaeon]|nr:hypothetical protein [Candidatus Woesearchaeota archaeon]
MEKIMQKLRETLKSNVVAIAAYGKKEEQHVIILKKLDIKVLSDTRQIIKEYYARTKKYPLLLTNEELTNGLDVFPLEFLNMKLDHNILHGDDIFKDLNFEKKHIRRELEFEFRSKLIHLRQGYIEATSKEGLKQIVEKAIPTLLPILNGLIFLKGRDVPRKLNEMLDVIAAEYGLDMTPLRRLQEENKQDPDELVKELISLLATMGGSLDKIKVEKTLKTRKQGHTP